jgi:hypothetical protein
MNKSMLVLLLISSILSSCASEVHVDDGEGNPAGFRHKILLGRDEGSDIKPE